MSTEKVMNRFLDMLETEQNNFNKVAFFEIMSKYAKAEMDNAKAKKDKMFWLGFVSALACVVIVMKRY